MPSEDEMRRAAFFAPCETKDHLQNWVREFLGLDLPVGFVCTEDIGPNEASNSSVIDLVWEVYAAARVGDPNLKRILAYAARDSGKTLACSILEVFCMFHLRRDVAHLAATLKQSRVCAGYIEKYFQRPILRDYLSSSNQTEVSVTWYESADGKYRIDWRTFERLQRVSPAEVANYQIQTQKLSIMVATLNGVNAVHASFVAIDECDLIKESVYTEANVGVPTETRDKKPAITFIISTRKFAFGRVQDELDRAQKTGLVVKHWNLIDVTEACPTSRHQPELPRIVMHVSDERLEALDDEQFNLLPDADKNNYEPVQAFTGCKTNCKLFAVCRGRLATNQNFKPKSDSTSFLKRIDYVTEKFISSDPEKAKSQLLCWKPGNVGLVYPFLRLDKHLISASKAAEMLTGEKQICDLPGLIKIFRNLEAKFVAGMDFGFTHHFAVALGAEVANSLFVFRSFQVSGFELTQKIELCDKLLKPFEPTVFADPAYPSDIKSFKKAGYVMPKFTKDVQLGVEAVRFKVNPALGAMPQIYWVSDDPGCRVGFMHMIKHHWKIDAASNEPTDELDEEDKDYPDAVRYLAQNRYAKSMHRRSDPPPPIQEEVTKTLQETAADINAKAWREQLVNMTGGDYQSVDQAPIEYRGRRRKFFG